MIHKEAYLEIGSKCFAKCNMCDMPKQHINHVPLDIVKERLMKLNDHGFKRVRLTGKEPLLYPYFRQVCMFMNDIGMEPDMTTTLLTPDVSLIPYVATFHKLRVSLFALYEYHELFYNVPLAMRHIKNISLLSKVYDKCINFNWTLTETPKEVRNWDAKSAQHIQKFVNEANLDNYCFNIFPEFAYKEGVPQWMMDELHDFTMCLDIAGIKYAFFDGEPRTITDCNVMQHRLFVKHDGSVYPCCMTAGEVGQPTVSSCYLGNMDSMSLQYIMNNRLYGLTNEVCKNCTQKYYTLMEKHNE